MKNKGFSLIQVMISFGLLSAFSLASMRLMDNQKKTMDFAEAKQSESQLLTIMQTVLYANKEACNETLQGHSVGGSIAEIKGKNGHMLFSVGNKYGNTTLYSITLEDQNPLDTLIELKIVFKREGRNTRFMSHKIPMNVDLNGTQIDSCEGNDFVLKEGDTMTGPLEFNITGNTAIRIPANKRICIGSNCRNFNAQTCPNGQVAKAINGNGSIHCVVDRSVYNQRCSTGEYLQGFNASGGKICLPVPSSAPQINYGSCVEVGGVEGVDGYGTFASCPQNMMVVSVCSGGENADCWVGSARYYTRVKCCPFN